MEKIRIHVKGDETAVRSELEQRGIPAELMHTSPNGTWWDVESSQRSAVVSWFCDGGNTVPFPPGTLLHYN